MWTPPPNVIEAGNAWQGVVPYVPGSMTSPSDPRVQREPGEGTKALAQWLQARWGLTQAGTRRGSSMSSPAQRADGTWRRRDLHEDGRAIDAMTGRNKAKGYEIANLMALFAYRLGVQYLLFDGYEWSVARIGPAWERMSTSEDRAALGRAPDLHEDHVHIELTEQMSRDGDRMRAAIAEIERALDAAGSIDRIRRLHNATEEQPSNHARTVALVVIVALVIAIGVVLYKSRGRWLPARWKELNP